MRTIAVEDDVYNLLAENTLRTGETTSSILRVLLAPANVSVSRPRPLNLQSNPLQTSSPLSEFIARPEFLVHPDVVSRYLGLLSWLHGRDPNGFKRIAAIGGRKRKYFATTADELEATGRMVMPKRIPNTPFWAVTNNATALKRKILEQVMRVLGYSTSDITTALSVLK
jgi:negative modulator of initiation of replication